MPGMGLSLQGLRCAQDVVRMRDLRPHPAGHTVLRLRWHRAGSLYPAGGAAISNEQRCRNCAYWLKYPAYARGECSRILSAVIVSAGNEATGKENMYAHPHHSTANTLPDFGCTEWRAKPEESGAVETKKPHIPMTKERYINLRKCGVPYLIKVKCYTCGYEWAPIPNEIDNYPAQCISCGSKLWDKPKEKP